MLGINSCVLVDSFYDLLYIFRNLDRLFFSEGSLQFFAGLGRHEGRQFILLPSVGRNIFLQPYDPILMRRVRLKLVFELLNRN